MTESRAGKGTGNGEMRKVLEGPKGENLHTKPFHNLESDWSLSYLKPQQERHTKGTESNYSESLSNSAPCLHLVVYFSVHSL